MKFKLEDLNDLLVEGECEYKVVEAEETIGKKDGKPQFVLVCKTADINGKVSDIKTWVPLWKLEEFCKSGGLNAEFEKREVTTQDCLKAFGRCVVKTQRGEMGENGKFPDRSIISHFLPPKPKDDFINDDIKF